MRRRLALVSLAAAAATEAAAFQHALAVPGGRCGRLRPVRSRSCMSTVPLVEAAAYAGLSATVPAQATGTLAPALASVGKAVLLRALPSQMELEIVARLITSAIIGMIIGMERRHSHRPAGVRTMALVALGAATFTIVSAFGFSSGDPGRVAANVASGVGFLGAGTITHPKRQIKGTSDIDSDVRGLTTAAAIWITAGLGMAAGAGMFFTAIAGTGITIVVLKMSNLKSVMYRRWRRWAVAVGLMPPQPPPKPTPAARANPWPLLLEEHHFAPTQAVDATLRMPGDMLQAGGRSTGGAAAAGVAAAAPVASPGVERSGGGAAAAGGQQSEAAAGGGTSGAAGVAGGAKGLWGASAQPQRAPEQQPRQPNGTAASTVTSVPKSTAAQAPPPQQKRSSSSGSGGNRAAAMPPPVVGAVDSWVPSPSQPLTPLQAPPRRQQQSSAAPRQGALINASNYLNSLSSFHEDGGAP